MSVLPSTMSRLLRLIVSCGLCISVFSDYAGKDCIFDFESYSTQPDTEDTVVNFIQEISTLTEGSTTYHYITGTLQAKSIIDNSYDAYYRIQRISDGTVRNVVIGVQEACYFSGNIYPQYLYAIPAKHNDFPSDFSICKLQPGSPLHILPANSSQELIYPSLLDEGKYYFEVSFLKNDRPVGGISGVFNVLSI